MPEYVSDQDNPAGPAVDVIEVQKRDPLRVLKPILIHGWMKRDTWSRREALMLLAGYNPSVTQWTETANGFGQFAAGNVGYLDALSESIIYAAKVNWRHPRWEEAFAQFLDLADYARGGPLDERRPPKEWIEWAETKGFTPYWLASTIYPETTKEPDSYKAQDLLQLRVIGHVGKFHLSASPVINGTSTISVGAGEVIRLDGKKILYHASSVSISNAVPGASKRVYLHDPDIAFDVDGSLETARSVLANCDEGDTPPGLYEGGLIVAGHLEIPPEIRVPASSSTQRPQGQQRHQEEEILRVLKELGFEPTALPSAGPGNPGAKKAAREKLSFSKSVFDKAWERLRTNRELRDA